MTHRFWMVLLLSLLSGTPHALMGRSTDGFVRSLDGEWSFCLDPQREGESQAYFRASHTFPHRIMVPGGWDHQGFGQETGVLKTHHGGAAWYARDVPIPPDWGGKRLFLCFRSIFRYARVWVNGESMGEHVGYMSPFEFDITSLADPGSTLHIAVEVDARQRWDIDTLTGSCFLDAYGGGISGPVSLEARESAWLEDIRLLATYHPSRISVAGVVAGDASGSMIVSVCVESAAGDVLTEGRAPVTDGTIDIRLSAPLARPWSPEHPDLYSARVQLIRNGTVLDTTEQRLGFRTLEIQGAAFRLNGKRLFLRGYGEAGACPDTVLPPADKSYFLNRLQAAKDYGFNHVRLHSHVMPDEFYDACDEVGILVNSEMPVVDDSFYQRAVGKPQAMDLYESEWQAAVKRTRNHASVFSYALGNEDWEGTRFGKRLYDITKKLAPASFVIDSAGAVMRGLGGLTKSAWSDSIAFADGTRKTLDYYELLFDFRFLPIGLPRKFEGVTPGKPIVGHELGNYITFPGPGQLRGPWGNIKPHWFTLLAEQMERRGKTAEWPMWAAKSERLYLLCHKLNIEALRRNPHLSGYHWWLFADYWHFTPALLDIHHRPKSISPADVKAFNDDVVLLQDRLRPVYDVGETIDVDILVSNYSETAIRDAILRVEMTLDGGDLKHENRTDCQIPQGNLAHSMTMSLSVPPIETPARVWVRASLEWQGRRIRNTWSTWVFPSPGKARSRRFPLYASADLLAPMTKLAPHPMPPIGEETPVPALYASSSLTPQLIDAAQQGASIVLISPANIFPVSPQRFKAGWWQGDALDSNTGTVVYDHPITREMAPEGWCDLSWYRLLENSLSFVIEEPQHNPGVVIRALDAYELNRSKALLLEAKVGAGRLILSGLNFGMFERSGPGLTPERRYLFGKILDHAESGPLPELELTPDWLHQRLNTYSDRLDLAQAFYVNGCTGVIRHDGEMGHMSGADAYVLRQLEPERVVEWWTADPARSAADERPIVFVFPGGLGWLSQPAVGGWTLEVNGKTALHLDVAVETQKWQEGDVCLRFEPLLKSTEDAWGLFELSMPAAFVNPSEGPVQLSVRTNGAGSRRWFSLIPNWIPTNPLRARLGL